MIDLFNQDFKEYIQLLNKYDVQYILVGGYAVNIYGYRRTTGDMDIWVNPTPENHEKMIRVHAEFGMHLGEMEDLNEFLNTAKYDVYTFGVSPCQIDVLTVCKGLDFDQVYTRSYNYKIGDFSVNLIHLNDLKIAKSAAGRTRDRADIEELEKALNNKNKSQFS